MLNKSVKVLNKAMGRIASVSLILKSLDDIVERLQVASDRNDENISANNVTIENLTVENEELIEDNVRAMRVQKNIYKLTH
jgi:hypothetical protein